MCTSPIMVQGIIRNCGKCPECLKARSDDLFIRMLLETKYHNECSFWTFTYDEENVPKNGFGVISLHKKDFSDFMKRLRKNYKCRVFYCGEYGGQTRRAHYHAIFFGLSSDDDVLKAVQKAWNNGFVSCSRVKPACLRYCAKYVLKAEELSKDVCREMNIEPQFIQSSTRPGLGYQWLEDNHFRLARDFYIRYKGVKMRMPRYFYKKCRDIDEYFEQKLLLHNFKFLIQKLKKQIEDYTIFYNKTFTNDVVDYYKRKQIISDSKARLRGKNV